MFRSFAACAAFAAVLVLGVPAHAAPLTLREAFARATASHPDLQALDASQSGLRADVVLAAQRPALVAGAELENVLGTGEASGVHGAELTLSLASVLERGDKRLRRIAVAQRALDAVALERDAKRLDLLAEVARRYVDGASAQARIAIASQALQLREKTLVAATERVNAGGAPVAVRLAADVGRLRAEGALAAAGRARTTAARRLGVLWGDTGVDFELDAGAVTSVPDVPAYALLRDRLAETPELRAFATEARLREARVQLARSAGIADLDWEVGVRRLQETSDFALIGSVSMPLGSAERARPGIDAAHADLARLEFEREGQARQLEATLAEVYGKLETSAAEARQLGEVLVPRLREAETAAAEAYRRGALSYLEWAELQGDVVDAERERLAAAVEAWRALIELQRLTGDSFSGVLVSAEVAP